MSYQNVIVNGRLGAAPELRYTPNGKAVANLRVAVNERWTDSEGQRQERTEWFRTVVWGRQAETCTQYLDKGDEVTVTNGRLQTRSYEGQDGSTKYITELVAGRVIFGRKANGNGAGGGEGEEMDIDLDAEDMPF